VGRGQKESSPFLHTIIVTSGLMYLQELNILHNDLSHPNDLPELKHSRHLKCVQEKLMMDDLLIAMHRKRPFSASDVEDRPS